ncbi:uncharacterized protein LOC104585139 [Brachypodium distachyon]|uniref:KIB1-4 beta-propeller domain-containing protein n=1 Tax=Brachypodium distachyon TaxID=15368 RepID=I1ISL1_BRADI|nr:uncharacterized protein LOC104585139 [Brachypodium distachyon]KQJ91379.1 hypothetical protein BRADI_4g37280v3 [Brachypodium distachyon]|eukprot:XP_010239438.1 uncharacterized protein LOC104585139 [Brachypodium distachyon]
MTGEERDWSGGLPQELLETIGRKIPPGPDAGAFRLTCPAWRAALPFSERFTPVVMLPFDPKSSAEVTFYRATSGELFTTNLPAVRGRALCGSSRGWLALVDEATAVTLLNPLTGATKSLPPLDEYVTSVMLSPALMVDGRWMVSSVDGALRPVRLEDMRSVFFGNVVLSAPPESGEFVAMVAVPGATEVAFCHVGPGADAPAPTWTLLDTKLECCVSTVVHCIGRFVAVGCTGEISVCDVARGTATLVPSLDPPGKILARGYLEWNGDLLLVGSMVRTHDKTKRICYRNRVYRCGDILAEKPVWSRVMEMRDTTLFVSNNCMVSFGGASVSGLRGDSVYFSEPLYGLPEDPAYICWAC